MLICNLIIYLLTDCYQHYKENTENTEYTQAHTSVRMETHTHALYHQTKNFFWLFYREHTYIQTNYRLYHQTNTTNESQTRIL